MQYLVIRALLVTVGMQVDLLVSLVSLVSLGILGCLVNLIQSQMRDELQKISKFNNVFHMTRLYSDET